MSSITDMGSLTCASEQSIKLMNIRINLMMNTREILTNLVVKI
jgi:hypothetical protein